MKLNERCPNGLSFRFGILSSFSLEDRNHVRLGSIELAVVCSVLWATGQELLNCR